MSSSLCLHTGHGLSTDGDDQKQSRVPHGCCVGAFSLTSESWTLKMEREWGPERGGLFLCRLQPLTERECLPLC